MSLHPLVHAASSAVNSITSYMRKGAEIILGSQRYNFCRRLAFKLQSFVNRLEHAVTGTVIVKSTGGCTHNGLTEAFDDKTMVGTVNNFSYALLITSIEN